MNNDLEQFSEERLKEIADFAMAGAIEIVELARIALAAKQVKPVAFTSMRWLETRDKVEAYTAEDLFDEKYGKYGMKSVPLYTTPPANSPAIPDGWIKCSDRLPDETDTVVVVDGGLDVYPSIFYKGNFYEYGDTLSPCLISNPTHWMPLPAAPKPESE